MSRLTTIVAILFGIGAVAFMVMATTGSLSLLWNPEAILIVIGGSLIAGIAGSSPLQRKAAWESLRALTSKPADLLALARWWLTVSSTWRREGVLALQRMIPTAPSAYAATIVQLCADGLDSRSIVQLAEQLSATHARRYEQAIAFFRRLGGYAPTMGIIGTVIGLISALGNSGTSPATMLERIALSFSATLWGLVTANFLWLPIAQRLQEVSNEQRQCDQLHIEAAQLAANGATPITVRYHLATLLPPDQQSELLQELEISFTTAVTEE
ncbi:MAG: MotA/TolQ/ExbB proton channel family protein [Chlorobi bacterium]|nr:MotA/TolQ/ExbB proton channel family protein [Chlorobiota bacterium]